MSKPVNRGAVITGSRDLNNLIQVKETPYPELEDDMYILKAVASAANPTDYKHIYTEDFGTMVFSQGLRRLGFGFDFLEKRLTWIGGYIGYFLGKQATRFQKGNVPGSDVSGIVEEVGSKVTKVKKGDIVTVSLHGGISPNGGYSDYVLVNDKPTIVFPPSQIKGEPLAPGSYPTSKIDTFEAAASVALGLKTVGLAFHYELGIPPQKTTNKDTFIIIWGGATATGILAIQIAKLVYGLKVITTASKKHHDKLKELGADVTLDYKDSDVVEQIKKAGNNSIKYGFDCVSSHETFQSVYDATEGAEEVVLNNLLFLTEKDLYTKAGRNVKVTFTDGYLSDGKVHFGNQASEEMMESFLDFWDNFLPPVLGELETAPLKVLEPGLQSGNEGLRLLIEGKVSGEKVVFRNRKD